MDAATYGDKESMARLPAGTYLGLYHGRNTPDEVLDDWGFDGPCIGPLVGYHTTYFHHIRICFKNNEDQQRFFPGSWPDDWIDLEFEDDMLKFDGKWYGDWTVFQHTGED